MSKEGWIKIYRKLLDNPIVCKDADHLAVWIYLLLNATHTNYDSMFKGKRITLKPGQLITGRKTIASVLKINESKVQRILKLFENEQQIEQQTSNQNRLITILNWESYQINEQQNEHRVNSGFYQNDELLNRKNTKNEQQMNNESKDNKMFSGLSNYENEHQMNNERTTSEQRVNTYNNDKNVIKNITTTIIDETPDTRNDNLVAQVGAGPTKQISPVEEIERTYLQIRNRPMCSSKDMNDIVEVYEKYKDVDFIIQVMKVAAEENRSRNGQLTINSFSYFVPIFEEEWNKRKAREKGDRHGPVSGNSRKNFKFDKSQFLWNGGENPL